MSTPDSPVDPALLRGLTSARLGRRHVLRAGALGASAAALAACGVKGKAKPSASVAPDQVAKFWNGKSAGTHVDFASWPLYMDPEQPELKKFTKDTGISVNYQEVIQDDASWFAKIQPQLAAKQSIGYDLMIVTNGKEFSELVQLGYLAPLDHSKLPKYTANAGPGYSKESYDPGNVYSIPWQSGITGIAYDPAKVGRELTSLADLWDPAFKGKIGMMSDPHELGNFGMLKLGISPEKSTEADWKRAADELTKQKPLVRKYYDQGYIDDLGSGDIWIAQAWSGDVFQKNVSDGTNLKFVVPKEGGTLWTDNMMIPITAANPVGAIQLADFFYDPDIAASLAYYVNYITPVPATKAILQKNADQATGDDKASYQALVDSPMVYPPDSVYANLHYYFSAKNSQEQQTYDGYFVPIVSG
jgi:spermidine/putrescine transport system substrate-binding protein